MSGTSLDGIDLACVDFFIEEDQIQFEWVKTNCISYSEDDKKGLQNLFHGSAQELAKAQFDYSKLVSKYINNFISQNNISPVTLIGFHGHTIFHQPHLGFTFQLGNPGVIAATTGINTVGDFRTQDVALGGQGAPLVPIGDQLLFSEYDACLNLGGIANISYQHQEERIAFDICPFNLVFNHYAQKIGLPFDEGGSFASKGEVNPELLNALNNWEYYSMPIPKSLGFESLKHEIYPLIDRFELNPKDVLATWVQHSIEQINSSLTKSNIQSLLVTGGGAYNKFFIDQLKNQSVAKITVPDKQTIEFKEALIFGLLAVLQVENRINTLKTVTGAYRNSISGAFYRA